MPASQVLITSAELVVSTGTAPRVGPLPETLPGPPLAPKLRVPLVMTPKGLSVVEQDSVDEVVQCVEYLLQTEPGTRLEVPDFGSPDPAFQEHPAKDRLPAIVQAAIDKWEPRARVTMSTQEIETLTEQVILRIGTGGTT